MAPSDANEKQSAECSSTEKPKRRINKPLIEKRRRERINECLNQLQGMITQMDREKSKTGRPAKLEKADILEMTVEYVRKSRSCNKGSGYEDEEGSQYLAGYQRCKDEIGNFFRMNKSLSTDLQTSILEHVDIKMSDANEEKKTDQQGSETNTNEPVSVKPKNIKSDQTTFASTNTVNIQPKLLPSVQHGNHGNAPVCIAAPQVVQQKATSCPNTTTNMATPMTLVCNRELPTFVLVPTATLCQSVQLPVGSQTPNIKGLPMTVLNTSTSLGAFHLNTTTNETLPNHQHPCTQVQPNTAQLPQVMIIPQDHSVQTTPQTNLSIDHTSFARTQAQSELSDFPLNLAHSNPVAYSDSSMWRPW